MVKSKLYIMENNSEIFKTPENITNDLFLSDNSRIYLKEIGSWGFFLAIMGFIGVGLIVLIAIFIGPLLSSVSYDSPISSMAGVGFAFIYLLIAAIYFFPVYYQYKFSTLIKKAILYKDQVSLELAFKNLKHRYKYIGIMIIVIVGFYLFFAIIGLAAGTLF